MRKTSLFIIIAILFSPAIASAAKNPFTPQLPKKEVVAPVKKIVEKPVRQVPPKPEPLQNINRPVQSNNPVTEKIILEPPALNITGLIWNSDRPQAIINEQVVDIGDEILATKIVSIEKTGIEILFDGRTLKIKP